MLIFYMLAARTVTGLAATGLITQLGAVKAEVNGFFIAFIYVIMACDAHVTADIKSIRNVGQRFFCGEKGFAPCEDEN
jgi:hypothetical protein